MSWVVLAVYAFGCWVFGLVALRVAWRIGSLVELAVGMIAIGVGGVGFPLLALPSFVALADSTRALSIGTAVVGLALASSTLYFSTWRVHRSGSVVAALVCTAGTFAIAWSFLAIVFTQGYAWPRDPFWLALQGAAIFLPYPWTTLELLNAARPLRRSRDEADRARGRSFLCYGIACGALGIAFVPGLVTSVNHGGVTYSRELAAFLIASTSITVTAATIGFVDPLRRALRMRAEAAEPGAAARA
jgi:hypothetical protein